MHYHLYKNPNENKFKVRLRRISVFTIALTTILIEKILEKSKHLSLPEISIPKISYSINIKELKFQLNQITKINPSQLDRIAATSLLIIMAVTYLGLSYRQKPSPVKTSNIEVVATAPAPEEIKKEAVAVVAEKALNFDFNSRYIPNTEVQKQKEDEIFSQKVKKVHDVILAMLEEAARMAPKEEIVKVSEGDTLMGLLVNKANVSTQEAFKTIEALRPLYNPRSIIPGNDITVFFHKDPEISGRSFGGIKIDKDIVNSVTVKREDNGEYTARQSVKNIHKLTQVNRGVINNSLYVDAKNANIPDHIIAELIKIYSWQVDFQRDIRPGNKFEVMYEDYKTEDGKTVTNKAKIVYAKLFINNEELDLYRFEDKDGFVDYYDANGRSAKKVLMKTPINGARLSSGFGRRTHPVLGYSAMHKGVDFAAPIGTPIYASGDGIIEKIEYWSSYGNYIRIRHKNNLHTAYAHMKGFKGGLKRGARVRQGDIIGYVGNTGRSTGPHLHYEVLVNNQHVNPSSLKLPTGISLAGNDLKKFKQIADNTKSEFRKIVYQNEIAENKSSGKSSVSKN